MIALVLYTLLSTAFWYLGSRAMITQAIWSRYPPALARFFDCPACSGFWYGVVAAVVLGWRSNLEFMGLASDATETPIVVGLCMVTLVPIVAGIMQWGFWQAGEAVTTTTNDD